jgi:hypothetical protein
MIGTTEVEIDRLASYRTQIEAEKPVRGKMSDTALAKLRAIKDQERLEAAAGERFKNALRSVKVTHDNLRTLV